MLHNDLHERIWTPDLFIRNLKSGTLHTVPVLNRLIRLSPDGTVFMTQRLSVTLWCEMHLERFPMDNQTCTFEVGSCEYEDSTDTNGLVSLSVSIRFSFCDALLVIYI